MSVSWSPLVHLHNASTTRDIFCEALLQCNSKSIPLLLLLYECVAFTDGIKPWLSHLYSHSLSYCVGLGWNLSSCEPLFSLAYLHTFLRFLSLSLIPSTPPFSVCLTTTLECLSISLIFLSLLYYFRCLEIILHRSARKSRTSNEAEPRRTQHTTNSSHCERKKENTTHKKTPHNLQTCL